MTKAIKLIGVLTIICVISALSLSYVYNDIAAPVIAAREKEEAVGSLRDIVPDADDFNIIQNDEGKIEFYEVVKDGEVSHVAIPCESSGFGGPVKLIVVTDMDGNIAGVNVAGQSETPGYGDRIITEPWFVEQFEGMNLIDNSFVIGEDVDALAGATVTSGAASRAIQNAAEYFMVNFMEGMEEQLAEQERQEAYDNMAELLPEAESFDYIEQTGETVYYTATTEGEVKNYGFITESKGLNAPVVILTVTDTEGEIVDNKVVSQADTPGYGDRIINEPEFMEQFIGMNLGEDSFIISDTIDGLAGATVTSTGATKAVAKASELWNQYLGDGPSTPSQGDTNTDEYDIESIMNGYLESIDEYQSISVDKGKLYIAKSGENNEAVGILTKAEGMVDEVVVLTISDLEGNIIDVVVVEQNDTPSIGEKVIEEEWFTDQYQGLNLISCNFEIDNEIDVIASVTVTSTAVNDSVKVAAELFEDNIKEGAGQ